MRGGNSESVTLEENPSAEPVTDIGVDPLLRVGNNHAGYFQWRLRDVLVDRALLANNDYEPKVIWPHVMTHLEKNRFTFFQRFFPSFFVDVITSETNDEIRRRHPLRFGIGSYSLVEKWELYRYFGIRLAYGLERPHGSLHSVFSNYEKQGSIFRSYNYAGRFGMSFTRFKIINDCFRLAPTLPPSNQRDPWHDIRPFITAFNENTPTVFSPGKYLCVDEIMSAWKGLSAVFDAEGIPHQTKIQRKPEGIGAEMKAIACGTTSIILQLDLMEGKFSEILCEYTRLPPGNPVYPNFYFYLIPRMLCR